jgi:hypothetical protein
LTRKVLVGLILAALTLGLVFAACGGDDDGPSLEEPTATATPTPVDATLLQSTLPPNEIVEADHYYVDAVCTEFVEWARARDDAGNARRHAGERAGRPRCGSTGDPGP